MSRRARVLAALLLAACPGASALNPALDVEPVCAHVVEGPRRLCQRRPSAPLPRRPTVISGWVRNSACCASMVSGLSPGSRRRVSISLPARIFSLLAARDGTLWIGTSKGLASWKDGKLTQYPALAGQTIRAPSSRITKARSGSAGWRLPPPGKLCAIRKGSVQCYGEDGALDNGVRGLFEDRDRQSLGGSAERAVAMEARPSEILSGAGAGRERRRHPRSGRKR